MVEAFAPDFLLLETVAANTRLARIVTETQAEAVLAELRPWLQEEPPLDQFRKQLEITVARTRIGADSATFSQAGLNAQAKLYSLSNPPVLGVLSVANAPEGVFSMVLEHQRPRKGPAPRTWYPSLVCDLAKIAEGIGVKVTTAGNRTDDPHATPFTRFVFAVERLLPRKEQSPSLAACAKRIDRAIVLLSQTGAAVQREGKRRKPPNRRSRDTRDA
jgi:hypothetical protein